VVAAVEVAAVEVDVAVEVEIDSQSIPDSIHSILIKSRIDYHSLPQVFFFNTCAAMYTWSLAPFVSNKYVQPFERFTIIRFAIFIIQSLEEIKIY